MQKCLLQSLGSFVCRCHLILQWNFMQTSKNLLELLNTFRNNKRNQKKVGKYIPAKAGCCFSCQARTVPVEWRLNTLVWSLLGLWISSVNAYTKHASFYIRFQKIIIKEMYNDNNKKKKSMIFHMNQVACNSYSWNTENSILMHSFSFSILW